MPATPLSDPPADGISSLTFSPTRPDVLLCSSWDGTVRCYDLGGSSALVASAPQPSACLAATFCGDDATAVVGGVDGSVRVARVDGLGGAYGGSALGAHEAGVRCLSYGSRANAAYSGSWDRTIACWDPRSGGRVASAPVPGKVFAMDLADHGGQPRLVVGTSDRHVLVFDARSLDQPLQERESPLKHQTRCLACFPDDRGFAVSSIEGRVAIEYFAEADQAAKYAFKCHRVGKVVYPVNALAFHPVLGTFATGGSDGAVNLWDGANKKRLAQLPQFPTSIAALAFSCDGAKLAVASSYCFEEGEKDHPKDEIYIHDVLAHEITPKS